MQHQPKLAACLWFDTQAEEAAKFYCSLFNQPSQSSCSSSSSSSSFSSPLSDYWRTANYGESGAAVSGMPVGSLMEVEFECGGVRLYAINGGPIFKFTPAGSFFVYCESEEEIKRLWSALSSDHNSTVRMPLDTYPEFQAMYGWVADKYGVNWQLRLSLTVDNNKQQQQQQQLHCHHQQKIAPTLMFVDEQFGKAEQAMELYKSLVKDSSVVTLTKAPASNNNNNNVPAHIAYSELNVGGTLLVLQDGAGSHGWSFNPAFSIMIYVADQAELDAVWAKLSAKKEAEQCGWLADKFGVSWQVVPVLLPVMMQDSNKERVETVMKEVLKQKKLDIAALKHAFDNFQPITKPQ